MKKLNRSEFFRITHERYTNEMIKVWISESDGLHRIYKPKKEVKDREQESKNQEI